MKLLDVYFSLVCSYSLSGPNIFLLVLSQPNAVRISKENSSGHCVASL